MLTRFQVLHLCLGLCVLVGLGACRSYSVDSQAHQAGGQGGDGALGGSTQGPASGGAGGGTAGTDETGEWCPPGDEHRCVGATLERCDPNVRDQWAFQQACASAELCDANAGTCRLCGEDAYRCESWNLELCSGDGQSWQTLEACPDREYCDSASGRCLTCLSEEVFCSGATLYQCDGSGMSWEITDCSSPDRCNVASRTCRDCIPGELQCSDAQLQRCSEDRSWEALLTCETAELCQRTRDEALSPEWGEVCADPVCEVGTFRCNPSDGRIVEACAPGRHRWEQSEVCETAALCDPVAGACSEGCTPGEYRCDGERLQVCNEAGTGFTTEMTCQSSALCNTARRDCVECEAGEYQCNGLQLQQCSSAHDWDLVESCASAALCSVSQRSCLSPGCPQAGTYSCDGSILRQCPRNLTEWVVREDCEAAALCNARDGRCNTGCATADAVRCVGQQLQRCAADRTGWVVEEVCEEGWLCNEADATCDRTCPAVPYACQLGVPVACVPTETGGAEWIATGEPCATPELCHADNTRASCSVPECGAPGDEDYFRCNPDNPQLVEVCNAGRTGYVPARTCPTGSVCDADGSRLTGNAQCDICTPGAHRCNGAELQQCASDGQSYYTVRNCPSADFCYAAEDGSAGYCYVCAESDQQCQGGAFISACADDRLSFVSSDDFVPCPNGCVDLAGHQDYCAGCPSANETQCVQTEAPGSLRQCPADRRAWSETVACSAERGCIDDGLDDYCVGCTDGSRQCFGTFSPSVRECQDDAWTTVEECSLGCFDDGNADYCGECVVGASECVGSSSLRTCVRGEWVTSSCGATYACHEGVSLDYCGACQPGTAECNDAGTARRVCNSREQWGDWESCQFGCHQDGTADYCGTCSEGARECTTGSSGRRVCEDGLWTTSNCSASAPYCADGSCFECASGTKRCTGAGDAEAQLCVNGEWQAQACPASAPVCLQGDCAACNASSPAECAGSGTARTCDTDTGEWVTVTCGGEAPYCSGGSCVQCVTGDRQCLGDALLVCVDESWEAQACPQEAPVCNGNLPIPDCAECNQSSADHCAAGVALICDDATGTWDSTDCAAEGQPCLAGACVSCEPGARDCEDDRTRVECTDDGSWAATPCGSAVPACVAGACVECSTTVPCPDGQSCVAGTCRECDVGDSSCSDGSLLECSDEGFWLAPVDCGEPGCFEPTPGQAECGACLPGEERCSVDELSVETCTEAGQWQATLCDVECVDTVDQVYCADCAEGEAQCLGVELQLCQLGRWELDQDCGLLGCIDGSEPFCAVCEEGYEDCDGPNTRVFCSGGILESVDCEPGETCQMGQCAPAGGGQSGGSAG